MHSGVLCLCETVSADRIDPYGHFLGRIVLGVARAGSGQDFFKPLKRSGPERVLKILKLKPDLTRIV